MRPVVSTLELAATPLAPRSSAMRPVVAVTVADCDTTRPLVVSPVSAQLVLITVHRGRGTLTLSVPQCRSHECELGASAPLPHSGPNPTEPNHQKPKNIDPTESNPWVNRTHGPGAGTRGTAFPAFFDRGDASPTPTFCTEIRAKVSPLLQLNGYLLKRSVR